MRRFTATLHQILLRALGLMCLVALLVILRDSPDLTSPSAPQLATMAALAMCLAICWMPVLPRTLLAPRTPLDVVPLMFLSAVAPAAAMLAHAPDLRLLPDLGRSDPALAALMAAPLLVTGMALVAMRAPATERRAAAPNLSRRLVDGRFYRLYVAADWLTMRLVGLGLLLVAATLWQLVRRGQGDLAAALTFDQPAQLVFYAYGAIGAMLVVPVVLPGPFHAPKGPGEGLCKALLALLAGVALARAVGVLWPGAVTAAWDVGLPAALAALPAGALVTGLKVAFALVALGAVAVPMARRAAGLRYDLEGRPVLSLTGQELRQLRLARAEAGPAA